MLLLVVLLLVVVVVLSPRSVFFFLRSPAYLLKSPHFTQPMKDDRDFRSHRLTTAAAAVLVLLSCAGETAADCRCRSCRRSISFRLLSGVIVPGGVAGRQGHRSSQPRVPLPVLELARTLRGKRSVSQRPRRVASRLCSRRRNASSIPAAFSMSSLSALCY